MQEKRNSTMKFHMTTKDEEIVKEKITFIYKM